MKIKNIFSLIITIIFVVSCQSVDTIDRSGMYPEKFPEIPKPKETIKIEKDEKLKVATILPLTGKNAKIGESMLNAINLSLFDNDSREKIELVIFDNKSSIYNSKKLIQKIADRNIKIVIGPIFTESVESMLEIANKNDIIVLSFSNNSDLVDKRGIFLSGFSPEQEIDSITSFIIKQGKGNFSVISPNNQYGIRIAKTLREMVEIKDANFISSQFYIGSKKNFADISNTILNSYIVSKEFDEYKEEIEAIEDKEEREAREIELITQHKIYADTVLISDPGRKAIEIANELKINNVDGRDIQIIGTSHWNKNTLTTSPALSGSYIAGPNNKYYLRFKEKYQQIYQKEPIRIASVAYDITAFVIDLANDLKNKVPTSYDVINYNGKKGYRGIDGLFRFLPNGIIERNLSILQIKNGEIEIANKAAKGFLNY